MSLQKSALQSVKFFDDMMSKAPAVFRQKDDQKTVSLNKKYNSHQKGGYEMAHHKAAKRKNIDEENDDEEETDLPTGRFVMPASYANIDELRSRLQAKIDEQKKNGMSDEVKKQKREKAAALEKQKKKQQKANSKLRKQEAKAAEEEEKAAKKAKAEEEAEEAQKLVQLQEPKVVEKPVAAPKSDVDFQFSAINQKDEEEVIRTAGFVSHKKGHKEKQLRHLERFQEKIDELKTSGKEEKAEKLIHTKAVSAAVGRAAGEVVKDNVKMLKKSLKRKEKSKEKSKEMWKTKITMQDKNRKENMERRDLHIKKKIEHKLNKKRGIKNVTKKPKSKK